MVERERVRPELFRTQLKAIETVLGAKEQWTFGKGCNRTVRINGKKATLALYRVINVKGVEETAMAEVIWFNEKGERQYAIPLRPKIIIEPDIDDPKEVTLKGIEIEGRKDAVTTVKISKVGVGV